MARKKMSNLQVVKTQDDRKALRQRERRIKRRRRKELLTYIILIAMAICGTYLLLDSKTYGTVRKRVGVSVVKDEVTGDHIVKLVNLLPVEVSSTVKLKGIDLQNPSAVKTLLTGDPKDKQARSVTSAFVDIGGTEFPYTLPAYSFTVIRIHENKGK